MPDVKPRTKKVTVVLAVAVLAVDSNYEPVIRASNPACFRVIGASIDPIA